MEAVEKKEYYPLSSAQKRLYILQQMEINSTVYNMPQAIPLPEAPDVDKLEKTFKQLIKRHESLRTSFFMKKEGPLQRIHDNVDFAIDYYDLTVANSGGETVGIDEAAYIRPFDLSRAPLIRVGLLKRKNAPYLLFVDMHHIISDGVSHQVLMNDYQALYRDEKPAPLPIQYKDFAQWRNSEKEKENFKRQEVYWLREFREKIPVLDLPTDYPRPPIQSFEGATLSYRLEKKETAAIKKLAREEGVTLYMLLLALFNIFLSKISNMEDIGIGTPTAGRRHPDLEKIMGMFVNTLVLRNYPNNNKPFLKFLHEVKERTVEAFENQDYPFEDLVENVDVNRDAARNPLFDVLFTLQIQTQSPTVFGESTVQTEEKFPANEKPAIRNTDLKQDEILEGTGTSKFDLTLYAVDTGDTLLFTFEYCRRLFKAETIRRFIAYFNKTTTDLVANPHKTPAELEIISEAEKKRILVEFNDTAANYPADKTIHELFAE
ncbi:MAG: non-ribosomal peptide synthetase, partial [bacterium]|nr:non-ribosomal peptide synthetase [bacterium]